MMQAGLITLILYIGGLLGAIGAIFGVIKWLWNSQNRAKIRLGFFKLLRKLGTNRFDKSTISAQTAVFMRPKIEDLNLESPEFLLPIAEIEFSKSLDETTEIKNGELYIRLRESTNSAENLVRIAEEYVRVGVMGESRRITAPSIVKAVELTVMHRLVSGSDDALRVWHNLHYQSYLSDKEILGAFEKTMYIDEVGYLTRIFMPETELVARRLGYAVRPGIVGESLDWLNFVYPVAQKCDSDPDLHTRNVNLVLKGNEFGVGIVLVARAYVVAYYGTIPHEKRIRDYLADPEIKDIILLGHGPQNCYDALRVLSRVYLDKRIAEVWPTFYRVKSRGHEDVPVVLARCTKGTLLDETNKRRIVQKFIRNTQKELPRIRAKKSDVIAWCNDSIETIFGKGSYVPMFHCGTIADAMNTHGFTIEDLDGILNDDAIEKQYDNFLTLNKIRNLYEYEEILYKIYVAREMSHNEIVDTLGSHITKNHGYQLVKEIEDTAS